LLFVAAPATVDREGANPADCLAASGTEAGAEKITPALIAEMGPNRICFDSTI